jgi:hypothetical protein
MKALIQVALSKIAREGAADLFLTLHLALSGDQSRSSTHNANLALRSKLACRVTPLESWYESAHCFLYALGF